MLALSSQSVISSVFPECRLLCPSRVSVLITEQELLPKSQAAGPGVQRLCLDRDWAEIAEQSAHNPNLPLGSRQRAYMIYTSGSTGLPKGAMVRHDGALNHIEAECEVLAFPGAFSFLQTAPSSSDISVWQFLGPVIRGGQVVVRQTAFARNAAQSRGGADTWGGVRDGGVCGRGVIRFRSRSDDK